MPAAQLSPSPTSIAGDSEDAPLRKKTKPSTQVSPNHESRRDALTAFGPGLGLVDDDDDDDDVNKGQGNLAQPKADRHSRRKR